MWYVQDRARPAPNYMVSRAGRSWTLRLFTDAGTALTAGSAQGIEKRSLRSLRSLNALRGVLIALQEAYPKLTRVSLDNAWFTVDDLIGIPEKA